MIFGKRSIEGILSGKKTQTRRLVGDTSYITRDGTGEITRVIHDKGRRVKWQVGKTYAVQPGRGKKQVARIRVLKIRREDVRYISQSDVIAEGFSCEHEFWATWKALNDPGLQLEGNLFRRPDHLYDVWVLNFELVR
jgi:hypothetical protein